MTQQKLIENDYNRRRIKKKSNILQRINIYTQILPKVGAPYYEGDQATCNHKEDKQ